MFRRALPSCLLVATCLFAQATDSSQPAKRWWAHVQYLADDRLEGRLTGTEGYRKAAEYVADRFKQYGLQPAGTQGYFQPVKFDVQRVIAAESKLALKAGAADTSVQLGRDALLSSRLPQPKTIEAPLVFAGYGLHIPTGNYDDFAGLDIRGKVIVYVNGGPSNIAGALKASARSGQEFVSFVEGKGALGVITIPNPKSMDIPWPRMALAASQAGMRLANPELQDSHGPFFSATWNPERAEELLAGSGHSIKELLALADAGKPLPHFPLKVTLKGTVVTKDEQVESPNIVGILPGADPKLKNEYVVYSAHLDHVGVGEPINGDKIYNGAMDNASGIASMLEVARTLQEEHVKLKRSILFVAVCAEEKGLLGSRYFAAKPTVPAKAMVANLNTDMFLPIFPLNYLTVYGADESTLGDDIKSAAAPMDIRLIPDSQPDRNIFIRSDQYNFIRAGVPAIMPAFGAPPNSPEEKLHAAWLKNRYHAPSDDTKQPVDFAAVAKFDKLMVMVVQRVANAPTRPEWKVNSYFRKFAHPATE
ncbi:MAG TPA: M20/M25/M40 family metallo-hydrolase [Bryobacteraceae bacterium]|nr:M20/M25/M40 family metallo-hydrolase [Bryobacteraceae bacterium]